MASIKSRFHLSLNDGLRLCPMIKQRALVSHKRMLEQAIILLIYLKAYGCTSPHPESLIPIQLLQMESFQLLAQTGRQGVCVLFEDTTISLHLQASSPTGVAMINSIIFLDTKPTVKGGLHGEARSGS